MSDFRAVDQYSGIVAERPSKFFQALDQADRRATTEAFTAAVGTYTCPCGGMFEFAEDSTLEEYAALNRWLGHHHSEEHDWAGPDEIAELRCRIDELTVELNDWRMAARAEVERVNKLTADADDVAETLMDLRDLNMRLVNENAALRQERDNALAAVSGRTL